MGALRLVAIDIAKSLGAFKAFAAERPSRQSRTAKGLANRKWCGRFQEAGQRHEIFLHMRRSVVALARFAPFGD